MAFTLEAYFVYSNLAAYYFESHKTFSLEIYFFSLRFKLAFSGKLKISEITHTNFQNILNTKSSHQGYGISKS